MPAADALDQELPKVTLAHLQRAESCCAFRLRAEHLDLPRDTRSTAAFAVSQRLEADVRLAHATMAVPRLEHFRPDGMVPEAAATYMAAARWYVALFGDEPVRVADDGGWSTEVEALGIRLVGPAAIALEDRDADPRLRFLRLAARDVVPGDVREWVPLRFALLRRRDWLAGRTVRVEIADLLYGDCRTGDVPTGDVPTGDVPTGDVPTGDVPTGEVPTGDLDPLDAWLADRVATIRARIEQPRRTRGLECGWCGYVALCERRR